MTEGEEMTWARRKQVPFPSVLAALRGLLTSLVH